MQLNNTYREKLLNAILFFAKRVKNPSKVKVFKLLYFLDFEHFKQTGRSVTNLDYYAYEWGPVPETFFIELKESNGPPQDFADALALASFQAEYSSKKGELFGARRPPNLTVFSPREKRILENLATVWRDADGETISEISHLPNQPWDRTITSRGPRKKIDYALALDQTFGISVEESHELTNEREEMLRAFPPLKRLHER